MCLFQVFEIVLNFEDKVQHNRQQAELHICWFQVFGV